MTTSLIPTVFDTVTGLAFIGVDWPGREGQETTLPANKSLDAFVGSILRLNNLYPTLENGATLSYVVGPRSFSIDVERSMLINGATRNETVRMGFIGLPRIPKVDRFTGLARGFEVNQQAGIAIGTSVKFPGNSALDYEQLAFFRLPKKVFSNHTLSKVLVKGNPNKLSNLMELDALYISSQQGFEANQRYLAGKGVVTFSPVNGFPATQNRNEFLETGLVSTTFFQSDWSA